MRTLSAGLRALRKAPLWRGQYLREGRRHDFRFLLGLGTALAFAAGALNAGGFVTLGLLCSHETGNLSRLGLDLSAGRNAQAIAIGAVVLSFLAGAFAAGLLLSHGSRRRWRGRRAFVLGVEALILAAFAVAGMRAPGGGRPGLAITLLAFAMGLQNAASSSLTQVELRTTHMTGNLTDLGLDLSHWLYAGRGAAPRTDRRRLKLHSGIVLGFLTGILAGAWAFSRFGTLSALPLAGGLALASLPSLATDLEARLRLGARAGAARG